MNKIQVEVLGLSQSPTSNGSYALILKESDGDRRIPIVIGAPEAGAIAYELEGVHTSRPMTHDLIKTIIETFDAKVSEIYIHEMKDSTFYASIYFNGTEAVVDSRPSDAIAIALRFDAPIYLAETLLDMAGFSMEEFDTSDIDDDSEQLDVTEDLEEDDETDFFLKNNSSPAEKQKSGTKSTIEELQDALNEAINDEDYEKAAKIRDEIDKLK